MKILTNIHISRALTTLYILFLHITLAQTSAQQEMSIRHFDERDGLKESFVSSAIQDHTGYIWLATHDGLVRYNGSSFKTFKAFSGDNCPLENNRCDYVLEMNDGNFFVRSANNSFIFNPRTETFTQTNTLIKNHGDVILSPAQYSKILAMPEFYGVQKLKVRLIDSQGGIWISSNRGLDRLHTIRPVAQPIKIADKGEEEIRAIHKDHSQRLWICDKNGYVRIYANAQATPLYLTPDGRLQSQRLPFGHLIYCIHEEHDGTLWLGTKPDGIFRMKPTAQGRYAITHFMNSDDRYSLSDNNIYAIRQDPQGRIWIATMEGGLNKVDITADGKVRFLSKFNLMKTYPADARSIHGMCITKDGILVLATNKGIYTADSRKDIDKLRFYHNIRRLNDNTSIPVNDINDVVCTDNGYLTVMTLGGGICYAKPQNLLSEKILFHTIDSRSGTATDVYLTAVKDHNKIWAVGKTALTEFEPATQKQTNYLRSLFVGTIFSEAAPLNNGDGTLLFGTTHGYLQLSTNSIRKSTFVPKIVFSCDSILDIGPDEKSLNIEFSALDYNRNEDIMYAYKIDGLSNNWIFTKENQLHIDNLPAGEYTLHVKSTNGDGVWTDNDTTISINRRPAFNETRLAWMLYGCLLLAIAMIVWYAVKYVIKLKREMSEYQLQTKEQLTYMGNRVKELMLGNSRIIDNTDSKDSPTSDELFCQKAKDYVRDNISEPDITVEDFARHMNVSTSKLFAQCKKLLGFSPNQYIKNVRLNYAMSLLESEANDLNIADIAYRCGFADPRYFSRIFKQANGCTPSEYAARFAGKEATTDGDNPPNL